MAIYFFIQKMAIHAQLKVSQKRADYGICKNNVLVTPRQIRDDLKLEKRKSLKVLKLILR